jgi:hypothetical protein
MKTADEMRVISRESGSTLMKRIETEVEVKAKDGLTSCLYLVEDYYSDGDVANAITELKLNGYEVDLESSSSAFNGKIKITW